MRNDGSPSVCLVGSGTHMVGGGTQVKRRTSDQTYCIPSRSISKKEAFAWNGYRTVGIACMCRMASWFSSPATAVIKSYKWFSVVCLRVPANLCSPLTPPHARAPTQSSFFIVDFFTQTKVSNGPCRRRGEVVHQWVTNSSLSMYDDGQKTEQVGSSRQHIGGSSSH